MNRFIEKKRECYALKSRDLIVDISMRQYLSTYDDKLFLEELKGALRLANCIALAPDMVPEKRPVFESLNRANNEWQSIGRQAWLKLYEEQKNRVCSYRTYGPTLRIKYPCGFVGFKGLPNQNGDVYADEPEAPPKSDDQKTLDTLLDLYYPDIRSISMPFSGILKTEIEWSGKNRLVFSAEKPAPEPTPETKKNTDQVNAVLGLWANCPQQIYGLVDKPKRDFGVTQTPKRSATDDRTSQYLQVCGRGLGKPWVWLRYDAELNAWEEFFDMPEPIKAEQLDPKACRQFVEQLLAFDELEKKRIIDSYRLVRHLQEIDAISHKSYCWLLEGLTY